MINKKLTMMIIALFTVLVLAGCGGNDSGNSDNDADQGNDSTENTEMNEESETEEESGSKEEMDHSSMDPSSSGEVPEDLATAENPAYPADSQAVIQASHMKGMDGAEATITGAFDTTAYTVTYTPASGGDKVEDHKWVIHEEIKNAGEGSYGPGDEVVLNAEHMEGMDGTEAVIDSAKETTVYMVSYTDTETGEEVTDHKWVTENELSPVEN